MDLPSSFLQEIAGLMALIFLLSTFNLIRSSFVNKKLKKAPQPDGALPLIGHLHLLRGQVPMFRTLSSMAEKHRPIFSLRLGFNCILIVSKREIARECLSTIDKVFSTRPNIAAVKIKKSLDCLAKVYTTLHEISQAFRSRTNSNAMLYFTTPKPGATGAPSSSKKPPWP